jgi:hypothetical protein
VLGAALVIVFATGGSAAGIKICPAKGTSCITASAFPNFVAVGSNGLAIAKFTNQSSSTTNHTIVAVNLPASVQAAAISSTPVTTCSTATVSCDFGSLPGHSAVKVFVQFTGVTAATGATVTGTVSFDEGNGNTGSPSNDTVTSDASNAFTVVDTGTVGNLNGQCTPGGSSLSASTSLQSMSASYPATTDGVPCTPVDTGIDLVNLVKGSSDKIVFVDLPHLSGTGLADVTYDITTLPSGMNVNNFVLFEVVGYPATIGDPKQNPDNFIAVPACVDHAPPAGSDACIDSRAKFGTKGIELKLKALGQGVDPAWWF